MNALSKDLRTRILEHYEYVPGATYESTANHFAVGHATVSRLVRHFRETGNIVPNQPKPKTRHKIDLDWILDKMRNGVNKLLRELVLEYEVERNIKVSLTSMWYALKALGFSYKKNSYSQRERIRESQKAAC